MSIYSGYNVSKTSFIKFEQCRKAFYLYKNHPYLRDKISLEKQATFKRGHIVGELAQSLFPGGIDVSKQTSNTEGAVALTKKLVLDLENVIYEAAFIYDQVLIYVDILVLEDGKYTAYEVKSSLKISEVYVLDACLQYYVLKNSLPSLNNFYLVTLNGDYTLKDQLEITKLFKKRSIKTDGEKNLEFFKHRINEANLTLEMNKVPDIPVGPHCFRPYHCDFMGTCWKDQNGENSLFNLPFLSKDKIFELQAEGIRNIQQIKEDAVENPRIKKALKSIMEGKPEVERDHILDFISTVKEPFCAIDLEVWNPAIPQLQGTSPFSQLPFLYCIYHTDHQDHFLTEYAIDNRKEFAEHLIRSTERYRSLLVYDKSLEDQVLNSLKRELPELSSELEIVRSKFTDISKIITDMHYYHPDFKNSFSLKTTCDALKLEVSYGTVNSGMEAAHYFEVMRNSGDLIEKQELSERLIEYCMNDAKAAYLLFEFLKTVVK